jgi:proteasome lid subunit RPN8/RPN11
MTRITSVFRRRHTVLRVHRRTWIALMRGLQERGHGTRESGAFLFGKEGRPRVVTDFVLYDDLDPECLTGGIDFHGIGYHRLTEVCRERSIRVVADVHTHPGCGVGQSLIDSSHPMVSRSGHVALIVPNFAQGKIDPSDVGVHRYRADQGWDSWRDGAASRHLYIGRWP